MTDLSYTVFDAETSINNKYIGGNKASPFFPTNKIVLAQGRHFLNDTMTKWEDYYLHHEQTTTDAWCSVETIFDKTDVLIGHNIKFDLLHLRRKYNSLYLEWVKKGGTVWDTQIVEYLLSGQTHTYPSLDQCAEKYGGTLKDDKIKEYWNNGISTEDIPTTELAAYLMGDIENTTLVFEKQMEQVLKEGMMALVNSQMNALLALVEMEHNGMALDIDGLYDKMKDLIMERETYYTVLRDAMQDYLPDEDILKVEINPASSPQLSTVLFGGSIKTIEHVQCLDGDGNPIVFKSGGRKGMIKTKKKEVDTPVKGMGVKPIGSVGKNGHYSTDDDTLQDILNSHKYTGIVKGFVKNLLTWRTLQKDITTYYEGLAKLVFSDGKIHGNFNQCSTGTGRLSCNAPNLQNITK